MAEKTVGKPIKRTEDPRLIQGLAHYVDDIRLPDTLHAAFLRSIYAHARIKSIDTTAAQKLPGVVAVYTGKDTQKMLDDFDAEQDEKDLQKRIAPRPAEAGVRRSGRRRVTFKGG